MCTLYDNLRGLCVEHGITGSKMCTDIGLSKSLMTGLKKGRRTSISTETAQKIADYFGVSVDRVLGSEQKKPAPTNEDGKEIGPNKQKVLSSLDDLSEEEAAILFDRIQKLKESRI